MHNWHAGLAQLVFTFFLTWTLKTPAHHIASAWISSVPKNVKTSKSLSYPWVKWLLWHGQGCNVQKEGLQLNPEKKKVHFSSHDLKKWILRYIRRLLSQKLDSAIFCTTSWIHATDLTAPEASRSSRYRRMGYFGSVHRWATPLSSWTATCQFGVQLGVQLVVKKTLRSVAEKKHHLLTWISTIAVPKSCYSCSFRNDDGVIIDNEFW